MHMGPHTHMGVPYANGTSDLAHMSMGCRMGQNTRMVHNILTTSHQRLPARKFNTDSIWFLFLT